ncbi:MAG: 3-isopropylmalate dehydratase large subunit [Alphaproteobacteria bacterium]
MTQPRTMFEKIWSRHVITENEAGQSLLFIDRHFCHELSFHAYNMLHGNERSVRRPGATFAMPDHYAPTTGLSDHDFASEEHRLLVENLANNARRNDVTLFGLDDERRGIIHVVGPEQGITQPGLTIVVGDSHTSTHGALGALAFGIGASDVSHVLATQSLWQPKPKSMRINITGQRPAGVSAKDIILAIIGHIGAAGGTGHVIEYAGPVIRALSIEERLTVCNMSIEAGARAGMVAPDDTTYDYLRGRPFAPSGADWDAALAQWRTLPSDDEAVFDREVKLDAGDIAPMVTWGTSPEDALPITGRVPGPDTETDPDRRAALKRKLDYMGLTPGMALDDIEIDRVFIGSCTNSRVEDLRAAAAIVRNRRVVVPAMVVPGSSPVRAEAETEGLDRVFLDAGFEWRHTGCSMCIGVNGDSVAPGERCASTSNRNFEGRQGRGARTHLVGPAMAAAAAVTGRLTDVRKLEGH